MIIGNTSVAGPRTFDGRIDEAAVYDYLLSPAAVRAHYGDTETYAYDSDYQLTGVGYANGDTQSYTYDAMGNRLTKVQNGTPTSYTYDAADQMLTAGGVSYSYDSNGNQTGRGSDTFGYDHENRLTSTSIGGTAGTYTYNGDGLRVSRTIGGSAISYKWDVARGLPTILQDSASNSYVYGLDLLSRTDGGGAQEYYLTDGLGSTTGLANGSGTVTGSYSYDAFGAVRAQTGSSPNEFKFTGEQVDASGMQYLRARYYDQATGRFASQDPLPLLHRYAYTGSNPVSRIDPLGLCSHSEGPWWKDLNPVDFIKDCDDDAGKAIVGGTEATARFALDRWKDTYALRAPFTIRLEKEFRAWSSGTLQQKEGGITLITNCRGLCELVQAPAFTIGHTIFTTQPGLNPDTLTHEQRHVTQYELLGDNFWIVYGGSGVGSVAFCLKDAGGLGGSYAECLHDTNILEILAD